MSRRKRDTEASTQDEYTDPVKPDSKQVTAELIMGQ